MAPGSPMGDPSRARDPDLLAAVAQSDVDARGEIYRRHSAAVFFLAHQLLGPTGAQEATQDIFLHVWDHADELLEGGQSLRTALLQLVRLRRLAHSGGDDATGVSDGLAEGDTFTELTDDEQAALELALQGMTYREAARRLGRSTEDVNELLRNALLKLYEGSGAPSEDPLPPSTP